MKKSLKALTACVKACRLCPRLVHFRETVAAKKAFADEPHWRKPVPGFGDPQAWLLITGLAPSIQGGNRTGRLFTGDESARFLFQALYHEGLANQPTSTSHDDGLRLHGCYMTAAVKCVPPQNKPTHAEFLRCHPYYENEIALLPHLKAVLALGKCAFDAYLFHVKQKGHSIRGLRFRHGECYTFEGLPPLYTCYHPSPQNTNTGKLTSAMMRKVLKEIKNS